VHAECKNNSNTRYNGGNWNHLKIMKKTLSHTRKGKNKGTTDNSHIGHCTYTLKSANVKVQKVKHGK